MNYDTMQDAGYRHLRTLGGGEHLLLNDPTDEVEVWFNNKNHAGYGIIYKNTHLEFARHWGTLQEYKDEFWMIW